MNIKENQRLELQPVLALLVVILASVGVLSGCGKKSEKGNNRYTKRCSKQTEHFFWEEWIHQAKEEGAGITATIKDVEDANGWVQGSGAAQVANTLKDA